MQESGPTETSPLICTSVIWGQNPMLSHPEPLQATQWMGIGGGFSVMTTGWPAFLFPSRVPSGLPVGVAAITDGSYILCFLILRAILHFSLPKE